MVTPNHCELDQVSKIGTRLPTFDGARLASDRQPIGLKHFIPCPPKEFRIMSLTDGSNPAWLSRYISRDTVRLVIGALLKTVVGQPLAR